MREPKIITEMNNTIKDISIADKLLQDNEIWLEGEVTIPAVNEIISLLHIIEQRCANSMDGIINADIRLLIAGPGGSVNAALNLAEYLKHTPLNVTGVAVNNCSSASALVWLACENREIFPYSRIMLHETSHMLCEDVRYRVERLEEIVADLNRLNDDVYKIIADAFNISKKEAKELIHCKDYYISADEIQKKGVATIVHTL